MMCVYVTCANRDEAHRIADAVVGEGLAACANIWPAHEAVYRWQGEVCRANETAMILKTTREGYDALERRIKALHSYDVPCVVAWDIQRGSADFLDWIKNNVL